MFDDEWDWDGDPVDLDACDVTGDPQLDVFGYQSPRTPGPRTGFKASSQRDWLAQSRRDRAEREAQAETTTAAEGGGAAAARVAAWPVGSADGAGRPLPAGDAASHEGAEGW